MTEVFDPSFLISGDSTRLGNGTGDRTMLSALRISLGRALWRGSGDRRSFL